MVTKLREVSKKIPVVYVMIIMKCYLALYTLRNSTSRYQLSLQFRPNKQSSSKAIALYLLRLCVWRKHKQFISLPQVWSSNGEQWYLSWSSKLPIPSTHIRFPPLNPTLSISLISRATRFFQPNLVFLGGLKFVIAQHFQFRQRDTIWLFMQIGLRLSLWLAPVLFIQY